MRWVLYVDMDAFYVNCELRDRPELRGVPVLIGHRPTDQPSRAVVLSASYEARRAGVRSALPVREAARRCPEAHWLPPDFAKYEARSREVMAWLRERFSEVYPQSIDEAMLFVEAGSPAALVEIAKGAQAGLRDAVGLPSSWGGAPHHLIAKIASDRAKPGGVRIVPAEEVARFLAPQSVRVIPGVGPKTAADLERGGVRTIADLAAAGHRRARRLIGAWGGSLVEIARGRLPPEEEPTESGPRSRSSDRTFATDVADLGELEATVTELARELGGAVAREGYRFGAVGVALRWEDFSRVQRGRALPGSTASPAVLADAASRLLRELWEEEARTDARRVRTVTVRVERLRRARERQASLDTFAADPSGD